MANKRADYWPWGSQRIICSMTGLKPQYLSDILHRRRRVSPEVGQQLEAASRAVGLCVPWTEWVMSKTSMHPAFVGPPAKKKRTVVTATTESALLM